MDADLGQGGCQCDGRRGDAIENGKHKQNKDHVALFTFMFFQIVEREMGQSAFPRLADEVGRLHDNDSVILEADDLGETKPAKSSSCRC